jgi:hypothetical protein
VRHTNAACTGIWWRAHCDRFMPVKTSVSRLCPTALMSNLVSSSSTAIKLDCLQDASNALSRANGPSSQRHRKPLGDIQVLPWAGEDLRSEGLRICLDYFSVLSCLNTWHNYLMLSGSQDWERSPTEQRKAEKPIRISTRQTVLRRLLAGGTEYLTTAG